MAIDPANSDAVAYLAAAERALGGSIPLTTIDPTTPAPAPIPAKTPDQPPSFANGRYQVKRFLGEGGKKKVYLAQDTLLDREVAFALIKTQGLDETSRPRVTREAQAMGRLGSHPHIVTVLDLGDHEGQPSMVIELMGGGDVEMIFPGGPTMNDNNDNDSLREFLNIKSFFGSEWLEEGCARFQEDIENLLGSARSPFEAEERAHPLHLLWHRLILHRPLPTEGLRGSSSGTHRLLGQSHRLLTIEYLLDRLRPAWNEDIAKDNGDKLRNREQFTATLYELEVADNFIREGFDINFQVTEAGRTADLNGTISGLPSLIECKRIEYKSVNARALRQTWSQLSGSILDELSRLGRPTIVQIGIYAPPTEAMLSGIVDWFRRLQEPPQDGNLRDPREQYVVQIRQTTPGAFRLEGDLEQLDHMDIRGVIREDGKAHDASVVAVEDHVPFDWFKSVQNSLRTAIGQLDRAKCNLVCLELADLANFEEPTEFWRIQEAIEEFLRRDTRRVSGVLLTTSGIVPEGENTYRSAGACWLFRHEDPYVRLPDSFGPPFVHPSQSKC